MQALGCLYIVATPIGNLDDMTLRAIETLKSVDVIAAEDTRHSEILFQHFAITTAVISLHAYNEKKVCGQLVKRLQIGEDIALISDAGTPLMSDPGYVLVQQAREVGIRVIPIPGCCAAIAALSASGLPTDQFIFEGFLPSKAQQRKHRLETFEDEMHTMIFYEAPHRILGLLEDMIDIFGKERKVVIARELTKKFETIYSGSLTEVQVLLSKDTNQQKGEFVVLVRGAESMKNSIKLETKRILQLLLTELSPAKAAALVAKIVGEKKKVLYELALRLEGKTN